MTDDADFASFWAIFPRKDRKPEARFEWKRAVSRFGAERVILTAARYCAESQGKERDDVLTAAAWLAGLIEPEREPGIRGLDPEKLGAVLLTTCMISWQLGHTSMTATVRDYLAPHGPLDAEHEFVYRALLSADAHDLVTEDEVGAWLQSVPLPAL